MVSCSKSPSQRGVELGQKECELKSKLDPESKEYDDVKKQMNKEFRENLRGFKSLEEAEVFQKSYYEERAKCSSANNSSDVESETQEEEQAESISALEIAKLFDKDQAVFSSKWDGKKVVLTDVMVNNVMDLTKRDKTSRHIEGAPMYSEVFNGKNIDDQSGSQEFVASIGGKEYQVYRTMIKIVLTDPSEIEQYMAPFDTEDKGSYIKVSGDRKYLRKVLGKLDQKDGKLYLKDAHIVEFGNTTEQETKSIQKSASSQNVVVNKKYYKIQDPDGYSNLRNSPDGKIIRKVYENENFEVIGANGKFNEVKFSDGSTGFIHQSRVIEVK